MWVLKCAHCGDEHTQSSRDIKRSSFPRRCRKFRPHNWSGLDRWDAIIRRTYGIALAAYDAMVRKQGGGCAICGKTERQEGRRLAIDHCHKTKKVRGALCGLCNQAIGMLGHDTQRIAKAVSYLKKYARAA